MPLGSRSEFHTAWKWSSSVATSVQCEEWIVSSNVPGIFSGPTLPPLFFLK